MNIENKRTLKSVHTRRAMILLASQRRAGMVSMTVVLEKKEASLGRTHREDEEGVLPPMSVTTGMHGCMSGDRMG